jgi:hypothetical protein
VTQNISYYYSKFKKDLEKTVIKEAIKLKSKNGPDHVDAFIEKIFAMIKKYPKDSMIEILFTIHKKDELLYLIAQSHSEYKKKGENKIFINLLNVFSEIIDMPINEVEEILTGIIIKNEINKIPVPIKYNPDKEIYKKNNLEPKEIIEYYKNVELLE